MKIKGGFITNSSSTSFILSMRDKVNRENFMKNIGVVKEFPLSKIFEDLFEAIENNKEEIHDYMENYKEKNKTVEEFLISEGYDAKAIDKVIELIKIGRTVYYGKISSDGSTSSEVYFCMESFLICDEDIYFNGEIGGW